MICRIIVYELFIQIHTHKHTHTNTHTHKHTQPAQNPRTPSHQFRHQY
jgi:hypothetical protein